MIVRAAISQVAARSRSSVRYYSQRIELGTNCPVGPFCTRHGYAMASMSYAGALNSSIKGGGGTTSSSNKTTDTSNSNVIRINNSRAKPTRSDWSARSEKVSEDLEKNQAIIHQLEVTYPPDNFPPVIISAWLDDSIQDHFSGLRTKYFPQSRNYLQGHITLFHALPSKNLDFILQTVTSNCSTTSPFEVFCEPYELTTNSAVFIPLKAQQLISIRTNLRGAFMKAFDMTNQDVKPNFKPHATVANKVTKEEAQDIFHEVKALSKEEKVTHGRALGLDVWFYRGGPWEHIRRIPFDESK